MKTIRDRGNQRDRRIGNDEHGRANKKLRHSLTRALCLSSSPRQARGENLTEPDRYEDFDMQINRQAGTDENTEHPPRLSSEQMNEHKKSDCLKDDDNRLNVCVPRR